MKKIAFLIALLAVIVLSSSCYRHEMEKVQATNDSLRLEISRDRENLTEFSNAFNSIQHNLDSIKRLEKLISVRSMHSSENQRSMEANINDDIRTIYELLKQNREKLASLRRNALSSEHKIEELDEMIHWLEAQIKNKNKEIEQLKIQLAEKNIKIEGLEEFVSSLEQQKDTLEEITEQQDKELHRRWYVIGNKQELMENGVIAKNGGFLGIGGKKELKADFNKNYFTAIDMRKTTRIPIYQEKVKVLTKHPKGSYRLSEAEKIEELQILDARKFWKSSDYLVILVK